MQISAILSGLSALIFVQAASVLPLSPNVPSKACMAATAKLMAEPEGKTFAYAKLFDAWGKPAGILEGGFTSLGDYDECLSLNEDMKLDVEVNYVLVAGEITVTLGSDKQVIPSELGVCLPAACESKHDVSFGLEKLLAFGKAKIPLLKAIDYKITDVHPSHVTPWSVGDQAYLGVMLAFFVLVFLGTFVDYVKHSPMFQPKKSFDAKISDLPLRPDESTSLLNLAVIDEDDQIQSVPKRKKAHPLSGLRKFLACFSLYSTLPVLFGSGSGKYEELAALNTVRTISIWWVILGHVCSIFIEKTPIDTLFLLGYLKQASIIIPVNAFFSVDTFFFLSGFLVAYMMFQDPRAIARFNYFKYVLFRYLRLTPSFAIVMFFWYLTFPHLGYGPAWYIKQEENPEKCQTYWWAHLLYINNFYPALLDNSCVSWSWYLAVDFQLYLVAPIFMLLLCQKKTRTVAYVLAILTYIICGAIIISGSIANHIPALATPDSDNLSMAARRAEHQRWLENFYEKPWSHLSVLIAGIFSAHLAFQKRKELKSSTDSISAFRCFMYQLVGAALMVTTLFLPYDFIKDFSRWSNVTNAVYNYLSRVYWSVGLGMFIYPSVVSPESTHLLTKFWRWSGWNISAKLTYGVYLVHIIIIQYFLGNKMRETPYKPSEITMLLGSTMFWSYLAAMVLYVTIEAPFAALVKMAM